MGLGSDNKSLQRLHSQIVSKGMGHYKKTKTAIFVKKIHPPWSVLHFTTLYYLYAIRIIANAK